MAKKVNIPNNQTQNKGTTSRIPNKTKTPPTKQNSLQKNTKKLPKLPKNTPKTTELVDYNNTIDKILDGINLPDSVQPIKNKQSKYNPTLVKNILFQIATDGETTIDAICARNGVGRPSVYLWALYCNDLYTALDRAKELRQDARIDSIEAAEDRLKAIIDDPDIDVREKHVQIQYYRTTTMSKFWLAGRLNKKYQEKTQDTVVTVNHADLRSKAWEQMQSAKEVPYKEVPSNSTETGDTEVSNNEESSE